MDYNPTGFDLVGWHVMQTVRQARKKVELLCDGDCIGRCCESLNVCLCCGRLYQMGLLASCWFKYFDDEQVFCLQDLPTTLQVLTWSVGTCRRLVVSRKKRKGVCERCFCRYL